MRPFLRMSPGVLLGAVLLTGLAPGPAGGLPAGEPHLPDLRTRPPGDLQVVTYRRTRSLLLSNTVWNAGVGPLQLRPRNDSRSGRTTAFQRVFTHARPGDRWVFEEEFGVGTFEYHPGHLHWHFEGFANYDLRNVAADGSIGRNVHRSSQKTSFCIIDTAHVDLTLEHSSSKRSYAECDERSITGLSVGWGDTYPYYLPGQSIDITNLPDGDYWLVSTADMLDRIRETNEANNWAALRVRIDGDAVSVTGRRMP